MLRISFIWQLHDWSTLVCVCFCLCHVTLHFVVFHFFFYNNNKQNSKSRLLHLLSFDCNTIAVQKKLAFMHYLSLHCLKLFLFLFYFLLQSFFVLSVCTLCDSVSFVVVFVIYNKFFHAEFHFNIIEFKRFSIQLLQQPFQSPGYGTDACNKIIC